MRRALTLSCLLIFSTWSADAFAGDCTTGGESSRAYWTAYPSSVGVLETDDVPANVVFFGGSQVESFTSPWADADGAALEVFADPDLSPTLRASQVRNPNGAFRPAAELEPGARYALLECDASACASFTVGEPDTTPPEQARVTDIELRLILGGHDGSGFSCPDWDDLSMNVLGSDDRTPDEDLIALAYIAPTVEDLAGESEPQLAFPVSQRGATTTEGLRRARFELGVSASRERDGKHFRKGDAYCFSIALMDRAGNIGPRSEPECIWTVDTSAPYATVLDYTGGCSVPGGGVPGSPAALAIMCIGLLVGRRRR